MWVSGMEFAYAEAPVSMQGVVMGINLATLGLGSLVGSAALAIVTAATPTGDHLCIQISRA